MINTTTIPTQMYEVSLFDVFTTFSTWFVCSVSIIEIVMQYVCKNNSAVNVDDDSDEDDDEAARYIDKYVDEFKSLTRRELTKEEMGLLKTKIVRETMPDDNVVIMTYDSGLECFCYYTDKLKDVTYDMLETIARKYAIDYDCKFICVDAAADGAADGATATATDGASANATASAATASATATETAQKSVFAKFKNYNTGGKGSTPNFNTPVKVIEQSNHFRFKGKLCDYEEQTLEKTNKEPILNYADYKNILEKKQL